MRRLAQDGLTTSAAREVFEIEHVGEPFDDGAITEHGREGAGEAIGRPVLRAKCVEERIRILHEGWTVLLGSADAENSVLSR
jgi:hypothetical protein